MTKGPNQPTGIGQNGLAGQAAPEPVEEAYLIESATVLIQGDGGWKYAVCFGNEKPNPLTLPYG